MSNFWNDLPHGFIGLSPMDGITDHPHRAITAKYGKPAVMYTEFTCVEGITHGAARLLKDFLFDETQRPIVGQIYGHTPEDFRTVAVILCQLGFDGIDINMGCPAKNVTHLGSGAALIRTPKLAQEIVQAVKNGVKDWENGKIVDDLNLTDEIKQAINNRRTVTADTKRDSLPISVKTRVGYDKTMIDEWLPYLLEKEPAAIALHGRTLKQLYMGLANWEEIGKGAELAKGTGTRILGNGDVKNIHEAHEKINAFEIDGVLIGRATWGNPWIFQDYQATTKERLQVAIEHAEIYENAFKDTEKYNFLPMRKHLGWYIREFEGASEVRMKAVQTNSAQEVSKILMPLIQEWT